jgi:P4 family phage/plasmid primase-like protien
MLVNVFRQYPGKDGRPASYPRSWPKNPWKETKPAAQVMELSEALTRAFRWPAYLVAYGVTKGNRRLSTHLLSHEKGLAHVGGSVEMHLFLVDVDGPSHAAAKSTTSAQSDEMGLWWESELPKIEALLEAHPGLFIYRSRNGYRIVGTLPKPIFLSSPAGADAWTRRYVGWCNYLSRVFGIRSHGKDGPDKLGDWTRLQRVPHDSRDFATPDQLEVIGDPNAVGEWAPVLAPEDMPAETTHRKHQRVADTEVSNGALLLALVRGRNLRCEPGLNGEYDICCPRSALHSPNESGERDYEGKTRLYTGQGAMGGIKCFSDGCTAAHPTPGHWMDEFSWQEKLAARRALGKTRCGDPQPVSYQELKDSQVSANAIGLLLEGSDDSKPDKTQASCVHQVACSLLRAGFSSEQVLGVLTSDTYPLAQYVLQQTDPGWYVLELLARAEEAMAEAIANAPPAPLPPAPTAELLAPQLVTTAQEVQTTLSIYSRVYSWRNRKLGTSFGDSDQMLTDIALECFGQRCCRRIEHQGDWLAWNGHRWILGENGRVRLLLGELCRVMKEDLRDVRMSLNGGGRKILIEAFLARCPWRASGDDDDIDKAMKAEMEVYQSAIKKLESAAGMNSIVTLIGDGVCISVDDLDRNADQLVFTNCVWEAATNTIHEPQQNALATRCIQMEWQEPPADARDRWRLYIESLGFDDQTVSFLQRSLGYAALGRGTEKRFWWFRGETGVSKSTIIDLVAQCMGTYAETTPTDLWLMKGGSRPGHTDDLAAIRGARFVTADEFPKICRFDDALMKRCTSGVGKLRVSAKGKTGFAYKPTFALVFASNFDPQIAEDDEALLARLTTFTFRVRIAEKDKNPRFVAEFLALPGQRLAILEWIMQGAQQYLMHGIGSEPAQVKASREDFMQGQISVEDQLAELLQAEKGGAVNMTSILERLNELQQRTRQRAPFTGPQIVKAILKRFSAAINDKGGVKVFHGVRLRDTNLKHSSIEDPGYVDPDPDYVPGTFVAPGF